MTRKVYKPGSPLRQPGQLAGQMVRDLLAARELAWRLFVRNISARYRQSLLGYLWAVLPPMATTAIWLLLTSQKVVSIDVEGVSYPVFLITGTILWQTFTDAVQVSLRVVSESRAMLAKINFPREALPMTAFAECWFNVLVRLVVLAVAYIFLDVSLAATFPLVLVAILGMILFGLLIGLLLSPFALLYDDVNSGLLIVLQVWFYCTPVIYAPVEDGVLGVLSLYNPMSPLLIQGRDWILTGNLTYLAESLTVMATTLVALFVALVLFRVSLPRAIERISS